MICIVLFLPWFVPHPRAEGVENTVTIETDDLNVRSGPGLHHDVVRTLNKGTKYPLLQKDKDWLQIKLKDGKKGWVAEYLVTVNKNDAAQSKMNVNLQKLGSPGTGNITADSLNVRSEPSDTGNIIGKLHTGAVVYVISTTKDWVEIHFEDGSGWVSGLYIEMDDADAAAEEEHDSKKLKNTTLTILHNGTNIRKSPNTQAIIVERPNEGDTYEAIRLENDWYEIKLSDGETGYVASWLVSETDTGMTTKMNKQGLEQSLSNKTIVIDPGHGGEDVGTIGKQDTLEKRITLQTAKYLIKKLHAAGANVILTRSNDQYIPLTSRVGTAYFRNADAFISLHYDSSKDKSVRGLTTYFYHPWQKDLAIDIHSAVADQTNLKDRGVRFGDYYVIRENNKKAVLIELGYLSNPAEELLVRSDQYQEAAATGIYEGLGRYFNEN